MSLRSIGLYGFLAILFVFGCRKGTAGKGVQAPDFALNDLNGRTVRLSDLRGKVVIIDFWASWCPPCKAEIPHFTDLYRKYKERGFEIVGVSVDSFTQDARVMVQEYDIPYPIVMGDQQTVKRYADLKDLPTTEPGGNGVFTHPGGIEGIPTTFVIDRKGKIYRKYEGYRDRETFERDIRTLL